jgi:hypothetical protein
MGRLGCGANTFSPGLHQQDASRVHRPPGIDVGPAVIVRSGRKVIKCDPWPLRHTTRVPITRPQFLGVVAVFIKLRARKDELPSHLACGELPT